jgi:hypothetical protein
MFNRILPALLLVLASCAATPVAVPMQPAVVRTIERVLERHDLYVQTDPALSEAEMEAALDASAAVRPLLGLAEVPSSVLELELLSVMARHDDYIASDPGLDELEREVYLADTARLRAILAAVPSELVPAS